MTHLDQDPDHKNYIFFGHGWSIPGYINLNEEDNVQVICLRDERLFTESRDFKIMPYIKGAKSVSEYYNSILAFTENTGNEVCVYSSTSSSRRVPNMLLSTGRMKFSSELTGFYDIKELEDQIDTISVQTLQELLIKLDKNFTIVIFACRGPLNVNDISIMSDDKGYFMNDVDILTYINRNNIPTTGKSTTVSICESFAKWLGSYSENDKNIRREEYNKEQNTQIQKQLEYKKQEKEQEVKPLIQSSNRWIPSFMKYTDKEDALQQYNFTPESNEPEYFEDESDYFEGEPDYFEDESDFTPEWNEPNYFEGEPDFTAQWNEPDYFDGELDIIDDESDRI